MSFEFVNCFSFFHLFSSDKKIGVLFSGPFTFLSLCIYLQDFCKFLLPTELPTLFQQANGTHFAYRAQKGRESMNLHFPKRILNDEWYGSMKTLAPFSSGQNSSEE